MHICIIGDPEDLTSAYISWLAEKRGMEILMLSEDLQGDEWSFSYSDNDPGSGLLDLSNRQYSMSDLNGAFVRLNPNPGLPEGLELPPEEKAVLIVERRYALQNFINTLACPVVNRPYSGRSNGSKPFQMQMLAEWGFIIPRWIVSNRATRVADFSLECDNKVIYKSCSGIRSKVRALDDQLFERLRHGSTPVVVQEYIEGFDVRVHIVGDHVFPTLIKSDRIDYRFDDGEKEYEATDIPDTLKKKCVTVARSEHLLLAGFDFRVTDDGKWYCLEVNPVPTFLPYEMSTGQAIASSTLDLFN